MTVQQGANPSPLPSAIGTERPGRIAVLTSNFPRWPGDSTTPFVLTLAADLVALGWEVDVLAPHAPGAERVEIMSGINVYRFRYLWPESMQTVCYAGGTMINLRKNPANWLKLPFLVTAELVALIMHLRRRPASLLHAHWILPQGFVAAIAARISRLPMVVTAHGSDLTMLQTGPLPALKRLALRTAAAITVNSAATDRALRALYSGDQPVHRIAMPSEAIEKPDPDQVSAIRNRHRRDGRLIVTVARLVAEKGVDDFLKAMALLERQDVRAVVVGEGQDRKDLERLRDELGLDSIVDFIGWVPPKEVSAYLHAADVFVGLSKTSKDGWVEGFGLTFAEALHAALPVVATRSGAIGEIIRDGISGLLVSESDPRAAADAIGRLLDDPDLARRLGREGQLWAKANASRQAAATRFDALFHELADKRPSCDFDPQRPIASSP